MPGLEHAVSAMTKRSDEPYGCHNRLRGQPWMMVQDGWNAAGQRHMVMMLDRMSVECRYDMSLSDKRCAGCQWAGSGEEYDQKIRSAGR